MTLPEIRDKILEDLDQLSPALQRRAQELVHELVEAPKGVPGKSLAHLFGILDEESAREMEEAIEEGCEQVEPNTW